MTGQLAVKVSGTGVRIEAATPGSQYKLSGFTGNFHDIVISGSRLISKDYIPTVYQGQQIATPAYIVGRQDIRNRTTTIQTGINDTLKFDFTYPQSNGLSQQITLELTLDAGSYAGSGLAAMIQGKLNTALTAKGLPADLIKAGVGGITTGVIGAEDDNVLNFSLNIQGNSAANGQYKIDGVRGNAAFSVFYKTDGDPVPAYITGTKNLLKGVVIPADKNDFTFKIGGKQKVLLIPPGNYTADGLIAAVNQCLTDQNLPLKASLKDGCLNLAFKNLGNGTLSDIGGGARGLIFFQEDGRINEDTDLVLQIGPDSSDDFRVKKAILNTSFLKVNTLCITTQNYARKSLTRIDEAVKYLGSKQGDYGAYTNRLRHVINVNAATRENLTASESRMRDADMAKEMMDHVKNNILTQSAQAMMSQANQLPQAVLQLLQ